ncbi:glycosyltransferase [Anaerobacillus alkaliphilus]|uniref:Glycosyltransferase n=1 Tax=Anaerobacillus alkaliphilus TaxID=1548597 RepID=A0A4Q0VN53_9BACI|nr:glycosyltransferase family 2 protein [Anaerobacillus alkaliphilus]RXI97766.1 glycosyltransferase [Anaerobacillus alkaliphilus]
MILFLIVSLTLFLLWTLINSLFLPSLPKNDQLTNGPLVSILVPLRNEEKNVKGLITSLKQLTYSNIEVCLLEDHSTDRTYDLLIEHTRDLANFHVIRSAPLPPDWVGKVFGCHQLSQHAKGDYYLFIDADVRLEKGTIEAVLGLVKQRNASLVSGFPRFPTETLLGNLLIPMQHFIVLFHLPLFMANYTNKQQFTAAHGAFMFFEKNSYKKINGHQSVKSSLVEDVAITKQMKKAGEKMVLANVTSYVNCHMYETSKEVWDGFTKNIFPGLGRSYVLASFVISFYSFFYVLPLFLAIYGVATTQWLFVLPLLLSIIQRCIIDSLARQRLMLCLFIPISALGLIAVLLASMLRNFTNKGYHWKGRNYS